MSTTIESEVAGSRGGGSVSSTPVLRTLTSTGILSVLLLMAVIGWVVTDHRMRGMGSDLGTAGFYVITWVVMMVAMMFPSIWPMVLMYSRIQRGLRLQGRPSATGATGIFVAGYLVTWTAWGLLAYGVIQAGRALVPGSFSWDSGGHQLAGGVIIAAGLYQFTSLKDACLTKCRSPVGFLLHGWRSGRTGAARMGIGHGVWCVGCCWGLMAALFALGVMSVGWMAFVAGLIAAEKLVPLRALVNTGIALLLIGLGLATAVAPSAVPGLGHM